MKPKYLLVVGTALMLSLGMVARGAEVTESTNNAQTPKKPKSAIYPLVQYDVRFQESPDKDTTVTRMKNGNEGKPMVFMARFAPMKDWLGLAFIEVRPCGKPVKDLATAPKQSIIVSGRSIQTKLLCLHGTEAMAAHVIESAADNRFVVGEFGKNDMVMVDMHGIPVPFLTEGFTEAFKSKGGKIQ